MRLTAETQRVISLSSAQDTQRLGAQLAAEVLQGLVFLSGPLGAGKTTLVRGWLRALGYEGPVKSPTFTLIEPYELHSIQILHFDLFRIENPNEIDYIGMLEHIETSQLQFVEWPERGNDRLPTPNLVVNLEYDGLQRQATVNYTNV